MNDLIVLVADKNMQAALSGILTAYERLQIHRISFHDPYVHPNRDPGVYLQSHEFLRPLQRLATHALVVFDREGCGSPKTRDELERDVEQRLSASGWEGRSAAIAIDPELENWVWSDSPHVDTILGWPSGQLRNWLVENNYWPAAEAKPRDPKEAVERALKVARIPRSSDIYLKICATGEFRALRRSLVSQAEASASRMVPDP